MDRREIREIRNGMRLRNCTIRRLSGCYVDAEKNIRAQWEKVFLALPEDEIIKYLDILRRALTGKLGKNLVEIQVGRGRPEADAGLLAVRDSRAGGPVLEELYGRIIEGYDYEGQYAILAAYGAYDIPGRTKDGMELEDGSEEVYEYILVCICPVDLQKPGLVYDSGEQFFTPLFTERMLREPVAGILYPAFNGRSQDTDAALCYCRHMEAGERELVEAVTGSRLPMSDKEERAAYTGILEQVLGNHVTLEEVRNVEEALQKLKELHKDDPEPYRLDAAGLEEILRESGIDRARTARTREAYGAEAGENAGLTLDNLGHRSAFTVKMDAGKVSLDPAYTFRAQVRELEGQKVLVLPLSGTVEVNGIRIDTGEGEREE